MGHSTDMCHSSMMSMTYRYSPFMSMTHKLGVNQKLGTMNLWVCSSVVMGLTQGHMPLQGHRQ